MIAMGTELDGKTIEKTEVYTDAVLMTLTDGTAVAVFDTDSGFRVQVASRSSSDMPLGVRVYPGQFPCPKLPEYARRR